MVSEDWKLREVCLSVFVTMVKRFTAVLIKKSLGRIYFVL